MRWLVSGLACALGLLSLLTPAGLAQPDDYLIVPGERVGRWLLGKPFDIRGLGRSAWRWAGKGRDIAYYDVAFFPLGPDSGLELRTCRSGGTSLSILAVRRLDQPRAAGEPHQYATTRGVRIGTDESDVRRLLGGPRLTQRWKERHGRVEVPVISYSYPGLEIRVNGRDRRVFGVGATLARAWNDCYQGAFGGRTATRRPELTVNGPQGVPLPRTLRLVPPGPTVPPAHAAFAGKWLGTWAGPKASGAHILVVEEITPTTDGPSRVVAVWAYTSPGAGRVWERITGMLDGDLQFKFEGGSYTYKMLAADVIETIWRAPPGEEIYAVMRKIKD
jgi:hypothetical protein